MKFYINEKGIQSNEAYDFRLDWIEKNIVIGKILDIGCASGGLLVAARDRGWQAFGVEISASAQKLAKNKYGLKVFLGDIFSAKFESNFFDAVVVGDLLEHLDDPKSFMFEVNRILKEDGILYLAVPDIDGLYYRLAMLISKINHKNYFVLPHHIYFFNKIGVLKYFKKCGFGLIDIKKSQSTLAEEGIVSIMMKVLFFVARLFKARDRILFLAKKS